MNCNYNCTDNCERCEYPDIVLEEKNKRDTWFNQIIEDCDNLQGDDTMVVTEFGKNKNLTLYIHKDCDYEPEIDADAFNLVSISTKQNDVFVDDTGDIHVSDKYRFRKELERIYCYENLETFQQMEMN